MTSNKTLLLTDLVCVWRAKAKQLMKNCDVMEFYACPARGLYKTTGMCYKVLVSFFFRLKSNFILYRNLFTAKPGLVSQVLDDLALKVDEMRLHKRFFSCVWMKLKVSKYTGNKCFCIKVLRSFDFDLFIKATFTVNANNCLVFAKRIHLVLRVV